MLMRLLRLGALVGSVMLLAATTVSMVNERAQLRGEQNTRVVATVELADQSIEGAILRALAVAEVATVDTDPVDLTASFGAGSTACVADGEVERCSGAALGATAAFGDAAGDSLARGRAVIVVDDATESALVVSRNEDRTVALQLPVDALIGTALQTSIEENDAELEVELSTLPAASGDTVRVGPDAADGRLVVVDTLGLPDDGGSVIVTASVADDVGLLGDGAGRYLLLLGLGTVLLALAGWTFLLDRRSLERRATTDELTGLVNRREFERVSDESLLAADRFSTGVCLMLIDLNGFKQINDTLGHQFGDLVLKAAAERLRSAVRDTDVVGRWGGDEFVILLPGIEDGTGVRASAERIGRTLAETPIVGDVSVTAAIGAALFPRHGRSLGDLISAADVAMYSAKTTGVTHRLADIHAVQLAADELRTSSGYQGPDRRRHPAGSGPADSSPPAAADTSSVRRD
jgi:diguanylate cyclase (GGDEF)-like protein